MAIPLKSQIRYMWNKAVNKNVIYSPIYERHYTFEGYGEFGGYMGEFKAVDYVWREAHPSTKRSGLYEVFQYSYTRSASGASRNGKCEKSRILERGDNAFLTKKQALYLIGGKSLEVVLLDKQSQVFACKRQPFKR